MNIGGIGSFQCLRDLFETCDMENIGKKALERSVTMSKTGVHLSGKNGREETRRSNKMKIFLLQVLTSLGNPTRQIKVMPLQTVSRTHWEIMMR